MDDSNQKVFFSGAIGLVILEKNKNRVFIFFDDHSNTKYCTNTKLFLNNIFDSLVDISNNTILLLEEPFTSNTKNIKFLWNDIPHVKFFNRYYKKIINKCVNNNICYTFPIDVRLCIIDISYDELINNINTLNYFDDFQIKTIDYFNYILYLFDINNINQHSLKNDDIIYLKKVFTIHKNNLHYKKLYEEVMLLYTQFIEPNKNLLIKDFVIKFETTNFNYSKGFPFININDYNDFKNKYEKIIDGIMELYTIILLICFKSTSVVIYCGYYHSNNIEFILRNYYDYTKIYENGEIDNIEMTKPSEINNCIYIDKKFLSKH